MKYALTNILGLLKQKLKHVTLSKIHFLCKMSSKVLKYCNPLIFKDFFNFSERESPDQLFFVVYGHYRPSTEKQILDHYLTPPPRLRVRPYRLNTIRLHISFNEIYMSRIFLYYHCKL